jgi:hypothetical protein
VSVTFILPHAQNANAKIALSDLMKSVYAQTEADTSPIDVDAARESAVEQIVAWEMDWYDKKPVWPRTAAGGDTIYASRQGGTEGMDGLNIYAVGPRFYWGRYHLEIPLSVADNAGRIRVWLGECNNSAASALDANQSARLWSVRRSIYEATLAKS